MCLSCQLELRDDFGKDFGMQNFVSSTGRRLAFHKTEGTEPTLVFLGGFKSDMGGTKAVHLEAWCKARGQAFVRFDYSGHGESDGAFTDGCIGDWAQDAFDVINTATSGPVILVGSSMGGWISLLLSKRLERIAGLVTIAAAPDFTEDGFYADFDAAQRQELETKGVVLVPSEYGDPYPITKRLITDGRTHLVLRSPLALPFPVRCLQGTKDTAVSTQTALRLLDHVACDDITLTLLKDADHSFSAPDALRLVDAAIAELIDAK